MFLLSLPQMLDNWQRNNLRDTCRDFLQNASLTPAGECGYRAALPVRMAPPRRSFYLKLTLGACQEFSNATRLGQPFPGEPYPYVSVPNAQFCLGADNQGEVMLHWWLCAFGGVCVFLVFLLRLRRLQTETTRNHDKRVWTVADYSVLIEGLARGREPDEQEGTL